MMSWNCFVESAVPSEHGSGMAWMLNVEAEDRESARREAEVLIWLLAPHVAALGLVVRTMPVSDGPPDWCS